MNIRNVSQQQFFEPGPAQDPEEARKYRAGREVGAFGDLNVQVFSDSLPRIRQTGDIRTQFETRESGGFYDPEFRAKVEGVHLGYEDNPVYGYMATDRSVDSSYGDARFTMKPSVKDRTTVFPDDSWYAAEEADYDGSPVETPRPAREGFPIGPSPQGYYHEAHIHHDPARPETMGKDYHKTRSRVPLSDVAALEIELEPREGGVNHMPGAANSARGRQINEGQQFRELGVPTSFLEQEKDYQPPLPYTPGELKSQGFEQSPDLGGGSDMVRRPQPTEEKPYPVPENVTRRQRRTWNPEP